MGDVISRLHHLLALIDGGSHLRSWKDPLFRRPLPINKIPPLWMTPFVLWTDSAFESVILAFDRGSVKLFMCADREGGGIMRDIALAVAIGVAIILAVGLSSAGDPVPYPEGYRSWFHVKSMVILPGHPLENPFMGIHHVYANAKAVKGLKTGKYEDGAVLVFDQLRYVEKGNSIQEGIRKLLGVMIKYSTKYASTGGWGFEAFEGNSRTKTLTKDNGKSCFACHASQKGRDYVFSRIRK
jgi:hypothetical protein